MHQQTRGLLQANTAAILLGGTSLFAELISLPAVLIITIRACVAVLVLLAILVVTRQRMAFSSIKDYVMQICLGVLMGIHWASYYHSIQLSTVAIGIAAVSAYPLYTVFIEAVCGQQKLCISKILITMLILFGVFLLIPEFNMENQSTEAVLWGLISGLAYALRNVLTKPYVAQYGGLSIMMHQAAVAGFFCAVLSFMTLDITFTTIDSSNWMLLILCGIVFTAGPHTLQVCAFAHLSASTVSNIIITQVLYASIFSLLILGGNFPDVLTILGTVCIVGGGILETYFRKKE